MTEAINLLSVDFKCFSKRYKAARPFRGEPNSGHAVPTAAVHALMELSWLDYLYLVFCSIENNYLKEGFLF
jgi:hypothetical protein